MITINSSLLDTVFNNINDCVKDFIPENTLRSNGSLAIFFCKAISQEMLSCMQDACIKNFKINVWLIGEQENSKVRSALIKACCQVAVFTTSPLQQNADAEMLRYWHAQMVKRVQILPECLIKSEIRGLLKSIETLELPRIRDDAALRLQNPLTNYFHWVATQCSDTARAFQSAKRVVHYCQTKSGLNVAGLKTKNKAVFLPEINAVVRVRRSENLAVEAITDQLHKLTSVFKNSTYIPTHTLKAEDEALVLKTLFREINPKKLSFRHLKHF